MKKSSSLRGTTKMRRVRAVRPPGKRPTATSSLVAHRPTTSPPRSDARGTVISLSIAPGQELRLEDGIEKSDIGSSAPFTASLRGIG